MMWLLNDAKGRNTMTGKENRGWGIKDLKRALKRMAAGAETEGASGRNVNLAQRANVVVSGNVGRGESSHAASSRQSVRIRQDGKSTDETSETVEARSESPS